jgi:DNA invertase Pin-like site-specific DNA recombinase
MATQVKHTEKTGNFVAYYRVSTAKQGQSGLGLQAQKESVEQYLNGGDLQLIAEFTEVETGKGSNALTKRPELQKAIAFAKKNKATLVIAKLDRLARNVHFIAGLLESGADFVAADMPEADRAMIQMMSVFAELEARRISERTKAALAQAKKNGVKLGNPQLAATLNKPRIEKANAFAEGMRSMLTGVNRHAIMTHLSQ